MKPHWGGGLQRLARREHGRAPRRVRRERRAHDDPAGGDPLDAVRALRRGGRRDVLPALWDPRHSHFDRYRRAAESMPALTPELEERVSADALTITRASATT